MVYRATNSAFELLEQHSQNCGNPLHVILFLSRSNTYFFLFLNLQSNPYNHTLFQNPSLPSNQITLVPSPSLPNNIDKARCCLGLLRAIDAHCQNEQSRQFGPIELKKSRRKSKIFGHYEKGGKLNF